MAQCAMLFDLHVHTAISTCSRLTVAEILGNARARGLDGVCLTDHDTMAVREVVREGLQADGLCVIVGMEYSTGGGDFLLFGAFEDLAPGLCAEDLLTLVEARRGAAVMAHPCRASRPGREDLVAAGLTRLVELMNGRNTPEENARLAAWTRVYPLVGCGGSDAHSLAELGRVGTRLLTPVSSRTELVWALRRGLCRPERLQESERPQSGACADPDCPPVPAG
jgi:predicted metal-dependent phosphoesterase TrpH